MALTVSFLLMSLVLFNTQLCGALIPTELIYQFPNGTFAENLAMRPNGGLLVTLVTSPDIYLIQPSSKNPKAKLLHSFAGYTSASGITEVCPDVFQVAVTSVSGPGKAIPGAGALYKIDLSRRRRPKVEETLKLLEVGLPNGLVTLSKHKILIADSIKGNVVVVDLRAKTAKVAITDPLLEPSPDASAFPGVNGLNILGDTLYFTNTEQNILGRIQIDLQTGSAKGPASKLVSSLPPGIGYDDFALGKKGDAYLASASANVIERVDVFTRQQEVVSGKPGTLEIAEPTSVAFGRNGKEKTLFVTTGGGLFIPQNGIVGAQVEAIKLGKGH